MIGKQENLMDTLQDPDGSSDLNPQDGCLDAILWKFRLYVAGNTPNSRTATINLETIGRVYLDNCIEVETIDVLKEPQRVLEDNIIVTPTLVCLSFDPPRKIIGNMNDYKQVMLLLGL
jgi:circadian clock protein KaiB